MVTVLESHLSLLEREIEEDSGSTVAERADFARDMLSIHVALYDGMERHIGQGGLTEAHRPLVPLIERWLHAARRIVDAARELRRQGQEFPGMDNLLRSMNAARLIAEDFDYFVFLNKQISGGEPVTYQPLDEVVDELHRCDRSSG